MLPRTRLGASGLTISRIVFGCMEFQSTDPERRIHTLHAAHEAGITTYDIAPLYGFGAAEEILGRAIADRRDRVEVLTKVGLRWDGEHGEPLFPFTDERGARRWVRRDARGPSVRDEVTASLRRLGVETLDLVQVHQPDRRTPFAETFGTLADLRREGKVRAVGVSNFNAAEVREAAAALGSTPLEAVQLEYNLVDRRADAELLPLARQRGWAVLTYSSLAQGLLAGRQLGAGAAPDDWRRDSAYYRPPTVAAVNAALEQAVLPLARERHTSPASVCLAWLLARPGVGAAIVGARTPLQAEENAAGATMRLSTGEHELLTRAFSAVDIGTPAPLLQVAARRARSLLRRVLRPGNRAG